MLITAKGLWVYYWMYILWLWFLCEFSLIRRFIRHLVNHLKVAYLKPTSQTMATLGSSFPDWKRPLSRDSPSRWRAKEERPGSPGMASHTKPVYMEAKLSEWKFDCPKKQTNMQQIYKLKPNCCFFQERVPRLRLPITPLHYLNF